MESELVIVYMQEYVVDFMVSNPCAWVHNCLHARICNVLIIVYMQEYVAHGIWVSYCLHARICVAHGMIALIYTCTYIYIYIYICVCVYIYIYMYIYVHIAGTIELHIVVHVHTWLFVCMNVCITQHNLHTRMHVSFVCGLHWSWSYMFVMYVGAKYLFHVYICM
jgi:hypothetical protein